MLFQLGKYRYYLSNEQIYDLNQLFANFSNGQLFLKTSQLINALRIQGLTLDDKEVQQVSCLIFKENKKCFFNVYEFIAIVGRYGIDEETQLELKKVFQHFDIKNRGKLTTTDLKSGLERLGQSSIKNKDIDRMFLQLDLDGDGAIDFEQFIAAMVAP